MLRVIDEIDVNEMNRQQQKWGEIGSLKNTYTENTSIECVG